MKVQKVASLVLFVAIGAGCKTTATRGSSAAAAASTVDFTIEARTTENNLRITTTLMMETGSQGRRVTVNSSYLNLDDASLQTESIVLASEDAVVKGLLYYKGAGSGDKGDTLSYVDVDRREVSSDPAAKNIPALPDILNRTLTAIGRMEDDRAREVLKEVSDLSINPELNNYKVARSPDQLRATIAKVQQDRPLVEDLARSLPSRKRYPTSIPTGFNLKTVEVRIQPVIHLEYFAGGGPSPERFLEEHSVILGLDTRLGPIPLQSREVYVYNDDHGPVMELRQGSDGKATVLEKAFFEDPKEDPSKIIRLASLANYILNAADGVNFAYQTKFFNTLIMKANQRLYETTVLKLAATSGEAVIDKSRQSDTDTSDRDSRDQAPVNDSRGQDGASGSSGEDRGASGKK